MEDTSGRPGNPAGRKSGPRECVTAGRNQLAVMRIRGERLFWIWLVFGLAFAACGVLPALAGDAVVEAAAEAP